MVTEAATEVDARFALHRGRPVLLIWAGANDIGGGNTGAGAFAELQSYIAARRAATPNLKVIGFTLLPAPTSGNPGFETERLAFNTLARASSGVFDQLVDVGGHASLQDATDTTYFNADKVHLNANGNALIAPLVKAKLDLVLP